MALDLAHGDRVIMTNKVLVSRQSWKRESSKVKGNEVRIIIDYSFKKFSHKWRRKDVGSS